MPSSFRIALTITEERECGVATLIERGEIVYYSAHQTQNGLEQFKVERAGFDQQFNSRPSSAILDRL